MIRPTTTADRPAVLEVVGRAFAEANGDGTEEVAIVEETWRRGAAIDLVATEGDAVVGHVLVALGDLGGTLVPGIAPLAVTPGHQRAGIGSALVHEVIARSRAQGWPLLLLLGSPAYYGRFGFGPAAEHGITYDPVGGGNPHFQALVLGDAVPSGSFRYAWE